MRGWEVMGYSSETMVEWRPELLHGKQSFWLLCQFARPMGSAQTPPTFWIFNLTALKFTLQNIGAAPKTHSCPKSNDLDLIGQYFSAPGRPHCTDWNAFCMHTRKMLGFTRRHLLIQVLFVSFQGLDCSFFTGAVYYWELPLVAISGMELCPFSGVPLTSESKAGPSGGRICRGRA